MYSSSTPLYAFLYAGVPAAPTNIQILCRNAVISWDNVDNATGYEILWRLLDEKSKYERIRTVRNRTEISLRNLSASSKDIARRYSARVTSLQNRKEGESSEEFVFATDIISKCSTTYS